MKRRDFGLWMNSFRRRRRKERAAGNNNGGRGARARGGQRWGPLGPRFPPALLGSPQRWAGSPRQPCPPCPASSPARRRRRPRAAAAGRGPGLSAARAAPLGVILRGSEGPNRRQPPLAEDKATPPGIAREGRGGGASCRLFNPFEEDGEAVRAGASTRQRRGWAGKSRDEKRPSSRRKGMPRKKARHKTTICFSTFLTFPRVSFATSAASLATFS